MMSYFEASLLTEAGILLCEMSLIALLSESE